MESLPLPLEVILDAQLFLLPHTRPCRDHNRWSVLYDRLPYYSRATSRSLSYVASLFLRHQALSIHWSTTLWFCYVFIIYSINSGFFCLIVYVTRRQQKCQPWQLGCDSLTPKVYLTYVLNVGRQINFAAHREHCDH